MGDAEYDENTFLCGYQRIRRYGSTQDLHSPAAGHAKYSRLVQHQVQPTDTLQSIQLKYNSSVFEIKRINRLWSNESIYTRTHLSIPIYDDSPTSTHSLPGSDLTRKPHKPKCTEPVMNTQPAEVEDEESAHDFLKRIDRNVRKTKKAVRKMHRLVE